MTTPFKRALSKSNIEYLKEISSFLCVEESLFNVISGDKWAGEMSCLVPPDVLGGTAILKGSLTEL